ncbi:unnamed protein product [Mytilus edulis]|uniref:DEAD/DEAH-box helicase domain-containing protein n=1 Tax=Mytilus edulis TaxID=6550 RepID=A0A8S3VPU8_MYTED|nr:unnamed protein product [Mytilus edulis]
MHTNETYFLRCQDKQGVQSLLSLLNNYNNSNSTTCISQLPDPITPLESPPIEPIYTAVPIDEFYNPKIAPSYMELRGLSVKLKPKQEEAVKHILQGRDVICYGKSMIFHVLPELLKQEKSAFKVLVVCPLTALIEDQLERLNKQKHYSSSRIGQV